MKSGKLAEHHLALSRGTVMKLADWLPTEEPLRQTFLSAPVIRKILAGDKTPKSRAKAAVLKVVSSRRVRAKTSSMKTNAHPKTWFISGTSSGFGRIVTERLLVRGDRVAATVRKSNASEAGYGLVRPSCFASTASSILAGRSLGRVQFLKRCGTTA
jgi:hypothetical protein